MRRKQWIALLLAAVMLLAICPAMPAMALEGDNLKQYANQHPRLFIDEDGFTELKQKIENNADMKALLEGYLVNLHTYAEQDAPEYHIADLEDLWMRDVGDRIGEFAFAYRMTGDRIYLDAGKRWIVTAISYPTWGRSAYENNDLSCAHMLVGLSVFYDWCYDELTAAERSQIVDVFKVRGGRMRRGSWWNQAYMQNHMWISVSGLMTAAAAIYDVYPEAEEWFSYGIEKFNKVFTFLEDGASHEGYLYWQYGMRALVYLCEIGNKFLNIDYTQQPYMQKSWEYALYMTLPFGTMENANTLGVFNFGDATASNAESSLAFLSYMAEVSDSKVSQWYANQCVDMYLKAGKMPAWRDFVFYSYDMEEEEPAVSMPTTRQFEELNYVFMRSDWSGDESAIAFRCGPVMGKAAAADASPYDLGTGHSHSDVNHFLIFANGEWLFPDDGYVTNSSFQHNTLIVNGQGQYGMGSWTKEAVAAMPTIDSLQESEELNYVVANGTAAYPSDTGLKEYKRHFLYVKPNVLIVIDEVEANNPTPLELRFHPASQSYFQQADGGYIFFGNNSKYVVKPFLENGVTSESSMIPQNADKSGSKRDKLAIQVKNTTDNWVQATAISWADRAGNPKQVDMNRNGKELRFTIDDTTVTVDLEKMIIGMEKMSFDLNVKYDGTFMHFNDTPIMENDRILIPVTEFIDVMNMNTSYNRATREIRLRTPEKEIGMKLLSNRMTVNGEERTLDAIPIMRNGSVYIPLRAVCEALELGIYYDEAASVANIMTDASAEIGILGMFVNGMPAKLVDEEGSRYESTIFDTGRPSIDILQLVNGTKADIAYTEGTYGEQHITLTSPDGKQTKEYILETKPYMGLGEIGISNLTYSGSDGNVGENTIDGDLTSRWSADGSGQWLLFDFGKEVEVGRIAAAFYSGQTRKTFFEIQVSDDGEYFTTVLDTESSGNSEEMEDFPLKEKVKTRYIRILGKGNSSNNWNSISEVGFYAE